VQRSEKGGRKKAWEEQLKKKECKREYLRKLDVRKKEG